MVTGVSSGSALITYTVPGGYDTFRVIVNPIPAGTVLSSTGRNKNCLADSVSFTCTTAGGTWSVSNTSLGTISATGGYYPAVLGINTISYTITALGCTGYATFKDTTITLPTPVTVVGTHNVCAGAPTTLSGSQSGGMWVSRDTAVAIVDASTGAVTGRVAGSTVTIVYTVSNICGSVSDSIVETVIAPPSVSVDTMQSVCHGVLTTVMPYSASAGVLSYSLIWLPDAHDLGFANIVPGGRIATLAGNGVAGYSGDGGSALIARVDEPLFIAVDASGNKYFADSANHVVRKVNTSGTITTVAGTGT
ncbi:MAG: hypothetical protein EBZ77_11080, partial [Chitinophagia bacterium]|nr:hypothetical protein [Chitinophagia bacterium]